MNLCDYTSINGERKITKTYFQLTCAIETKIRILNLSTKGCYRICADQMTISYGQTLMIVSKQI